MIFLVTNDNFSLLDPEIEEAYRRRCEGAAGARPCACLRNMREATLVRSVREAQRRLEEGRAWLRRLAEEVDALAQRPKRSPRRRGGDPRLIAANSQKPAPRSVGGGKRRRSASA